MISVASLELRWNPLEVPNSWLDTRKRAPVEAAPIAAEDYDEL